MPTNGYRFFIDWDGVGFSVLDDFAGGFSPWESTGSNPPDLSLETSGTPEPRIGDNTLLIEWYDLSPFTFGASGLGFDDGRFGGEDSSIDGAAERTITGFEIGNPAEISLWFYVPSGSSPVELFVVGGPSAGTTTTNDDWELLTVNFTPDSTSHAIRIRPTTFNDGDRVWVDALRVLGGNSDVTSDVLERVDITWHYGRDEDRAIGQTAPSEMDILLDNRSLKYTPQNDSGPLFGLLRPGARCSVETSDSAGIILPMFRGFIDKYQVLTGPEDRSVRMSWRDEMSALGNEVVRTEVFQTIRTGEAIDELLDAVGWPAERRDIDPGASILPWWWEDGTTARDALQALVESEGMPSYAAINREGVFIFRDRHHRLLYDRSRTVQATFREGGAVEPVFSSPHVFDIGWEDVANRVEFPVVERTIGPFQSVWLIENVTMSDGDSFEYRIRTDEPWIDGFLFVDSQETADKLNFTSDRFSGQSTVITVNALEDVTIPFLSWGAHPVTEAREIVIEAEDATSVTAHGKRLWERGAPWVGQRDAEALADLILNQRAEPLPIVSFMMEGSNQERLDEIIHRDLSDRIRVIETQSADDNEYFVERIDHEIIDAGQHHRARFGVERARENLDDPDVVFILDQSELGTGRLGH